MRLFFFSSAMAIAVAMVTVSQPASANGRFPAANLVVEDPSDAAHLLVRATYGVLITHDRGDRWEWVCEGAVGFSGFEDPMMAILQDGSIVAGVFQGLSSSKTGGCDWSFATGALEGKYAVDLTSDRNNPANAILIISNSTQSGMFLGQLWETTNNGDAWTQAGVDLPADFLALNVDASLSDPNRVYISGRYGPPDYQGALQRTFDRGQMWERLDIPDTNDLSIPYLSAVDPTNPDVVYVRLDKDPMDALVVSTDGGQMWTQAFEGQGNLFGFALSPDGKTVMIGGDTDGLWRAPTDTLAFEKVSDIKVKCLTWTAEGLYACADEFTDGFTMGISTDEGQNFTPLLHLNTLCGPLACSDGSDVQSTCADVWGATQLTLQTLPCDAAPVTPQTQDEAKGCGCRVGTDNTAAVGSLLLAFATALGMFFRRGQRSSKRG